MSNMINSNNQEMKLMINKNRSKLMIMINSNSNGVAINNSNNVKEDKWIILIIKKWSSHK